VVSSAALTRVDWRSIADAQAGMVARGQVLALGISPMQARAYVDTGRWRRVLPGVYATFTGPISAHGRVWAALLYAGRDAAASHGTALWLWGLTDEAPAVIDVVVPESRRVLGQPGVRIHRRSALDRTDAQPMIHPAARPPRVRLEQALLDACDATSATGAIDLVLRATQRRLTTADLVRTSINQRSRVRWRSRLLAVLQQVEAGVASPLELEYRRAVECRHRLPAGLRNVARMDPTADPGTGTSRYAPWRVVIELDGREAHPAERAFRDLRRDNAAAVAGETVLRYGWRDIAGEPCSVARQVGAVLALNGWADRPRRCGDTCTVDRAT